MGRGVARMPTGDRSSVPRDVVGTVVGRPVVVAHRGNSVNAPQNTLAAFDSAWQVGAAMVELDVQLTADRHVVVIHDDTVDATTDGTGAVSDLSLAEVRALDAGAWFAQEFAGQRVPTLGEVLDQVAGDDARRLLIELKGDWDDDGARLVTDPVVAAGLSATVIVQSFSRSTVAALARVAPQLRRGLLIDEVPEDLLAVCADLGVMMCNPLGLLLLEHTDLVERLHAAGLEAYVWTLDEPEHWRLAVALGVDGIISNDPGGLHRLLS